MMVKSRSGIARCCVLVLVLAASATAQCAEADDDAGQDFWRINVGVRGWYNQWTSWDKAVVDLDNNQNPDSTVATSEDAYKSKVALIPQVSLQLGNFALASSYFNSTSYQFIDGGKATRKEFDINGGYSVMPGLTMSVGYKMVRQVFDSFEVKIAGPVLGFSGSAQLGNNFGIYANFAFGPFDAKFESGDSAKASYTLAEPGLSYVIPTGGGGGLDALVLTLGYRFQSVKIKDDSVSDRLFDNTRGITVGIAASF